MTDTAIELTDCRAVATLLLATTALKTNTSTACLWPDLKSFI